MADNIELNVTANDKASSTLDEIASKAQGLDGASAEVTVEASDNAGSVLDDDQSKLDDLDGASAEVTTEATDNAGDVLDEDQGKLDDLDGSTAEVTTDATDGAGDTLQGDIDLVDQLDGSSPTISPEVTGSAEEDLQSVEDKASELDGQAPQIQPEVDPSGEAQGNTEALGTALGVLSGKLGGAQGDAVALGGALSGVAGPLGDIAGAALPVAGGIAGAGAAAFAAAKGFEGLALQAKGFSTTTGTTLDEASRWIEVSNDLGVGADTVQGAIGRMNKAIGTGKLDLADFGIAAGSSSDNFQHLIEHLGAIPDPAERAAKASAIFGRAWQNLAPLIDAASESTTALSDRLGDVSDEKLQTDDKVKAAKEFRDALDSVTDTLDDVKLALGSFVIGPISDAAAIVGNVRKGFQELSDTIKGIPGLGDLFGGLNVGPLTEITNGIKAFKDATDTSNGVLNAYRSGLGDLARDIPVVGGALSDFIGGESAAEAATRKHTDALREQKEGNNLAAAAAKEYADKQAAAAKETEEGAAANAAYDKSLIETRTHLLDLAKAEQDRIDASRAAADASVAVQQATDKEITFLDGLSKEISDAQGNQQKLNDINREAIGVGTDKADSLVRQAEEQAKASGTTVDAVQKQDIWNNSMIDSANNLNGPLRGAVLAYIAGHKIPPEKLSEIQALIDQGKLDEAKQAAGHASATRTAAIVADADTAQANKDIDYAAREREVNLIGRFRGGDFVAPGAGLPGLMAGGNVTEGGFFRVGEAGAETVFLPGGSAVRSAGDTMAANSRGSQPTIVNNITVNVSPLSSPAQVGREIQKALDAYYRTSGSRLRAIS
jgi:soluble cytochrome b562